MMTKDEMRARLLNAAWPEPKPKLTVASDRKLSLEGQRERVVREVKELAKAERRVAEDPARIAVENYKQKLEHDHQAGLYYRSLYESTAR